MQKRIYTLYLGKYNGLIIEFILNKVSLDYEILVKSKFSNMVSNFVPCFNEEEYKELCNAWNIETQTINSTHLRIYGQYTGYNKENLVANEEIIMSTIQINNMKFRNMLSVYVFSKNNQFLIIAERVMVPYKSNVKVSYSVALDCYILDDTIEYLETIADYKIRFPKNLLEKVYEK